MSIAACVLMCVFSEVIRSPHLNLGLDRIDAAEHVGRPCAPRLRVFSRQ